MHSKSCLAVCLPLSAFMISLFWFLKILVVQWVASLLIGFDTLTECSHSWMVMLESGWVGSKVDIWPAVWECGALWVIPYMGAGSRSHSSVPEEEMKGSGSKLGDDPSSMGKLWGSHGQRAGCQPAAHLAAGKATAPWTMWTGTWPGVQGKGLSLTQCVFMLCPVSSSPSKGGTSKTSSEFSEGLLESLISVAKAKTPTKNVCMHFMVWLDESTESKWIVERGKRSFFVCSLCLSLFRPDALMGSASHEI